MTVSEFTALIRSVLPRQPSLGNHSFVCFPSVLVATVSHPPQLRAFLSPVMTQSQIHEVLPKAGLPAAAGFAFRMRFPSFQSFANLNVYLIIRFITSEIKFYACSVFMHFCYFLGVRYSFVHQ